MGMCARALLGAVAVLLLAGAAMALEVAVHGDFSNELRLYSNQAEFFRGDFGYQTERQHKIGRSSASDSFVTAKYRLWSEIASDEGAVKGVYAIEMGGLRYGDSRRGGGFSGDGVNLETRWAYTDLALVGGRLKLGLQPVQINPFLWNETATGAHFQRDLGGAQWQLAWYRGYEVVNTEDSNDFQDLDALYLRCLLKPATDTNLSLFALWQHSDGKTLTDEPAFNLAERGNYLKNFAGYDLDLYTLGFDGSARQGNLFARWDLLFQFGDLLEKQDFGGYLIHLDLGAKSGSGSWTYTFWLASGDKDATDDDYDAFIATDCDTNGETSSVVLFEGYASDDYFSAVPYVQDKGLILNRLGYDHQLGQRLTVGGAILYLLTAEKVRYADQASDRIGWEVDAYARYLLYPQLELALQGGYLWADDVLDYYENDDDGQADSNLLVVNARVRYRF